MRDRRHLLHARALQILASGGASMPLESHAQDLHRHAVGAEDWPKAVTYARLAAAEAIERSAYRGALAFSEAALDALSRLEQSKANTELAIDIRLEARLALGATAQLTQLLAYATDAETKARAIGDSKRALTAVIQKASALTYVGASRQALATGEEALQAALAARVPQIELVAHFLLAQCNYAAGNSARRLSSLSRPDDKSRRAIDWREWARPARPSSFLT